MKSKIRWRIFGATLFCLSVLGSLNAQSTLNVLHSFTAVPASAPFTNSDGTFPRADLIQSGGTLYGTASQGGSSARGTIFSININGTGFTNLHNFNGSDGGIVYGGLVLAGNTLYGTTSGSGSSSPGTIFSINTNGTGFVDLYHFTAISHLTNSDGGNPQVSLILSGNTLYGTAKSGGSSGNGTVFRINTDGSSFTNLHNFAGFPSEGSSPQGGLILLGNTLYGTTRTAGSSNNGTIFRINTDGAGFTNLHNFAGFPSEGYSPQGSLISSGNTLYGTTFNGGISNAGTVFCIDTNGASYRTLHSFVISDGLQPVSDLFLSGNTLYGTTQYGSSPFSGNVFSMNTDGTDVKNLYNFTATLNSTNSDGASLLAGVILLGNTLYGVASQGGGTGHGTVFALGLVPALGIAPVSNQVAISWPSWATNFGLQTTTDLFSGSWSNVTSGITTVSAGYVFTNTVNGKAAFFRLRSQ